MQYKELDINDDKVFEVAVVATMSSGKSTLVNALIGDDILPSRNEACTARTTVICDNDKSDEIIIHILDEKDNYKKIVGGNADIIEQYNDSKVKSLIVECDIAGIRNLRKSLILVDTPGTNNNNDQTHEEVTLEYIRELDDGLILFVLDATHTETEDEKRLLEVVRDKIIENNNIKVIFVINKFDEVDFEKESPYDFVENRYDYLNSLGFENFDIVTISAQAAKIFKKILKGKPLSKQEKFKVPVYYDIFKDEGTNYKSYLRRKNGQRMQQELEVNGKLYTRSEIVSALDNTGLTTLEELIEERMIDDCSFKAQKIKKVKNDKCLSAEKEQHQNDNSVSPYISLLNVTRGILQQMDTSKSVSPLTKTLNCIKELNNKALDFSLTSPKVGIEDVTDSKFLLVKSRKSGDKETTSELTQARADLFNIYVTLESWAGGLDSKRMEITNMVNYDLMKKNQDIVNKIRNFCNSKTDEIKKRRINNLIENQFNIAILNSETASVVERIKYRVNEYIETKASALFETTEKYVDLDSLSDYYDRANEAVKAYNDFLEKVSQYYKVIYNEEVIKLADKLRNEFKDALKGV